MPARRLRVLHCFDTFEVGGTEMNAVRTVERLDRSQYDLSTLCLTRRGPLEGRVLAAGVSIHEFRIGSLASARMVRQGMRLARWLRDERIDVVHAHDVYTNIFAVPWARLAGVPLVIASRRWWTETNRAVHVGLNRWSYRLAHRVLANSASVGKLVASEGVAADRIDVIPNFVDETSFSAPDASWLAKMRQTLDLSAGDLVIGIVANLHTIKDHASLLHAMAQLSEQFPTARLVIVGDGVERAALESLADSLSLREHVRFAGRLSHQPSPHWLFDISVLCSRGEGFPNSLVEAMAAGRPVVATDVGGVPDVVLDGVTGTLVPPGEPSRLAEAMRSLLLDSEGRVRFGRAGRERAREHFFVDGVLRQLDMLYARARHGTSAPTDSRSPASER